ncbi:MAG: DUF4838 domain-containing protein [Clostridia bacterium]|nr:DUF4838 domain-containing protein [Clostridia bacterium]
MNRIELTLGGNRIEDYTVVVKKPTEATVYAASELVKYLLKATGKALPVVYGEEERGAKRLIVLAHGQAFKDGFRLRFEGERLCLTGNNERSAIYAVYEFLERIGWRFFAQKASYVGVDHGPHTWECEKLLSEGKVDIPSDFSVEQEAVFDYRDGASFALNDEAFCVKLRINAQTWGSRDLARAQYGGARTFAGKGCEGHTFGKLVPIGKYGKTNPEFFAELDGVRKTEGVDWDNAPQLCMTNYASVPVALATMKEWMAQTPRAEYISVSQNDNRSFCQCASCRASYARYGYFGTLIRYVNEVAVGFAKAYPNVKIHTYAYAGTDDINDSVKAHKNVMVQWCPTRACRNHALNDRDCALNRATYGKLQTLSKVANEIFVYDYRHCLRYAMLNLTDLFTLRETMRTYAELHVKGIYSEVNIHALNQCTFEELRAYLFAKLVWDPYMSEAEYDRHINEFLEGYYGKGWRRIREYLDRWNSIDPKMHYTSFYGAMISDEGKYIRDEQGNARFAEFMPKEEVAPFCAWANGKFDEAAREADYGQKLRIEIARTNVVWYELFHRMEEVMRGDDEAAKAETTKRCRDLCSRMRRFMMKYTVYIGMTNTTYMYDDFSLPVSQWRYANDIAGGDPL